MKNFILFTLLLYLPQSFGGIIEDFRHVVQERCQNANLLLIKKSLIELNQNMQQCEGTFTQKILQSCKEIDCEYLTENYNKVANTKSGSVIGR